MTAVSPLRPGISSECLASCGIRHVEAPEAFQLCGISEPGLWIPFFELGRTPMIQCRKPYGRLRLDKPQGDKKYYQRAGTEVRAYIPPPLADARNCDSLAVVEGEFKSMALTEAGIPAIGISSFWGFCPKGGEKLLPEIATVIRKIQPANVVFFGDSDTTLNADFAFAALRAAQRFSPCKVFLPRLPMDGPKGIDDCREEMGDDFNLFLTAIVKQAIPVDPKMTPGQLAVKLFESELPRMMDGYFAGFTKEKAERRMIDIGAAHQEEPMAFERIKNIAVEIFGTTKKAFMDAVKVLHSERKAKAKAEAVKKSEDARKGASGASLAFVQLPGQGRTEAMFSKEVAKAMTKPRSWFVRGSQIVTIRDQDGVTFDEMTDRRSATALEEHVVTYRKTKEEGNVQQTPSLTTLSILLRSDALRDALPKLTTALSVPLPLLRDGKISWPKPGYNEGTMIYLSHKAPSLERLTLTEAKSVIEDVIGDFPFKVQQDKVNATAYLLTLFCKGLLPTWNTRCPLWIFLANRQRAGKDYLAGVGGVLIEGRATEDPPLSNDQDELRKFITTAQLEGRKRLHFANCRGHIASSVLEQFLTSPWPRFRILGGHQVCAVPNEIDVSLSGNVGVTITPDLALRSRKIELGFYEEDANSRIFRHPDLHGFVDENRGRILGALAAFVSEWDQQGRPEGKSPFTSFHHWAKIIGGIMQACGLGDPCAKQEEDLAAMDSETADMTTVFQLAHETFSESWISIPQVREMVSSAGDVFGWMDLDSKKGQTAFGMLFRRYTGRELGGIKMEPSPNNAKVKRSISHVFRFRQINDHDTYDTLLTPPMGEPTHTKKTCVYDSSYNGGETGVIGVIGVNVANCPTWTPPPTTTCADGRSSFVETRPCPDGLCPICWVKGDAYHASTHEHREDGTILGEARHLPEPRLP